MGITFFFLITLRSCHALPLFVCFVLFLGKRSQTQTLYLSTLKAAKLANGLCHYSRSVAIMACWTERQLWWRDAVGDRVRVKGKWEMLFSKSHDKYSPNANWLRPRKFAYMTLNKEIGGTIKLTISSILPVLSFTSFLALDSWVWKCIINLILHLVWFSGGRGVM